MQELDKAFLFRSTIRRQAAPLNNSFNIYILTAIRHIVSKKRGCNYLAILFIMRLNNHTTNSTDINTSFNQLISAGYISKHNTAIRITPAGLQALTDIERQLKECTYKMRKSDVPKISVKRPKTL
jgi:ribosomal protein S19E (S16A)